MFKRHKEHKNNCQKAAFTLIELLVVIAIIALLISMLTPSLEAVKEFGRLAKCLSNLHNLGVAMSLYHTTNNGYFWQCNPPDPNDPNNPYSRVYFWGRASVPVDIEPSPLMAYCDAGLPTFWCPCQPWGSYVPQGKVKEPTTNFGYNAWCLDPPFWWRTDAAGNAMPIKQIGSLSAPSDLFVFADSAMFWAPAGVGILQNSTSLDPVTTNWGPNQTATTQFRHLELANALCADGHVASFDRQGGTILDKEHKLGFVGARNIPHYDQE